eukprot:TRINITY_DN1830_c0_g1_i2.p3 TRINITY_DN1830_c0_g1~~TRINITY_DN1830_c0_g1_i2.p3  ORF type:complete len:125 (-),score=39.95 TRINITY_DN1830_c0_g1_i2:63-437(-)
MPKESLGKLETLDQEQKKAIKEFGIDTRVGEGEMTALNKPDKKLMAKIIPKMDQKELLKTYVSNWKVLNKAQRRKVLGKLNAVRSQHAKLIMMKELYAIGQQRNKEGEKKEEVVKGTDLSLIHI